MVAGNHVLLALVWTIHSLRTLKCPHQFNGQMAGVGDLNTSSTPGQVILRKERPLERRGASMLQTPSRSAADIGIIAHTKAYPRPGSGSHSLAGQEKQTEPSLAGGSIVLIAVIDGTQHGTALSLWPFFVRECSPVRHPVDSLPLLEEAC